MAGIGSASSAIWITAVIINVYDCVYDDTLDDDDDDDDDTLDNDDDDDDDW